MRVAVVGAGLQAKRRIQPVVESPGDELVVVSSGSGETARALADGFGCEAAVGWEEVVARPDVDAVIICTPPHLHADIALAAVQAGKHVLCEKPLARTLEEGERMLAAAAERGVVLRCGFNHRYHPAVRQVREWVDAGLIGEVMFIRCRYGHCGRPGYEADWRSDPRLVGGGHLMEHGIHAIDLIRWLSGCFGLDKTMIRSSELSVSGSRSELLLAICRKVGATDYLSGVSGREYLDRELFQRAGIRVRFQEFHHPIYRQCYEPFIPALSSVDLLFNHGPQAGEILAGERTPRLSEVFT